MGGHLSPNNCSPVQTDWRRLVQRHVNQPESACPDRRTYSASLVAVAFWLSSYTRVILELNRHYVTTCEGISEFLFQINEVRL